MAYSCDLAVMDYHGLSWMTFMDDFMDVCKGWLSWMTFMNYFHVPNFTYWLHTFTLTDGHWYLLSHYCDWKLRKNKIMFVSENRITNIQTSCTEYIYSTFTQIPHFSTANSFLVVCCWWPQIVAVAQSP